MDMPLDPTRLEEALPHLSAVRGRIRREMARRIVGQEEVIELMLAALFARGHALLIGVPGLAKTQMAKTLAACLALVFRRVQFTPDLMPSDITGTDVIAESGPGRFGFEFTPGPIFAHIVLADEINRTPPKTQAALLEAMQELQVTVGRRSHPLPDPFFVLATQNPIEQEGTYPLPEAQLDRFMFRIPVVYPSREEEERIISEHTVARTDAVAPVVTEEEVRYFQRVVEAIAASPDVIGLASRLVRSTRPREEEAPQFVRDTVEWGASPRAGQALVRGARALAALDGRPNVAPADVLRVAAPVLAHRITLNYTALAEGATPEDLVARLVGETGLPEARKYGNLLRGGATG